MFTDKLKILSIDFENDEKKSSKILHANKDDNICFKIRRRWITSEFSTTSNENENLSNYKNCIIKNELLYKNERLWMFNWSTRSSPVRDVDYEFVSIRSKSRVKRLQKITIRIIIENAVSMKIRNTFDAQRFTRKISSFTRVNKERSE